MASPGLAAYPEELGSRCVIAAGWHVARYRTAAEDFRPPQTGDTRAHQRHGRDENVAVVSSSFRARQRLGDRSWVSTVGSTSPRRHHWEDQ